MEEIPVIFNPAAHSQKAERLLSRLERLPGCILMPTRSPGDERHRAAEAAAAGFKTVVAAGGDGTINGVVNGMAGTAARLGVLPIGTMNVFASELGIPQHLEAAWDVILAGNSRPIDLCSANDSHFVQLAGVGFDAEVVARTTRESKMQFGPLSYIFSAAHVAGATPPSLQVQTDHGTHEGRFVLIGNGRFYGGQLQFFHDARLDDGKLDLLVFKNYSHLDIVRYFGSALAGWHTLQNDVEYLQTTEAIISSTPPVRYEVDGELSGQSPVRFRISPKPLEVLAPVNGAR